MTCFFKRSIYICSIVFLTGLLPASAQPIVAYTNFITSGLNSPIEIVNAHDGSGRLFIAEQGGAIKVWQSGTSILATAFLTIPSSTVLAGGERGLLSLAFHPDYATNGFFYVYYTRNPDGAITIARYHVNPASNVADPGGTELLVIPHPGQSNHNGGHLHFRVEGGINYLYFATGDGGGNNDPLNNSQNDASMLGKIIRMNVDLTLPITPEIFAKGLRNPFRWSFDRLNGNMWIGDVGQGLKEEVNFLPAAAVAGANFGWRCYEGTIQNTNVTLCDPPGKIPPVFEYNHPGGSIAITGGYVYRGSNGGLYGYYLVTEFYTGKLWLLNPNGSVARTQTNLPAFIAAYGEDEAGELYAVSIVGNMVYSISATGNSTLPITLINFSAQQFPGYNELRWSTSLEQNADKYIIEYSTDGSSFAVAGEVAATNNSSGAAYSFRHTTSNAGKLFYRLQMRDLDANLRYSSIISVGGKNTGDVKIYPTLLKNNLLNLNAGTPVESLKLYSSEGKEMYSNNLNGRQGYFSIQLPALPKGIYFVAIRGKDLNKTERILIQ
jgi:glucose/arabinose dehydrogenase